MEFWDSYQFSSPIYKTHVAGHNLWCITLSCSYGWNLCWETTGGRNWAPSVKSIKLFEQNFSEVERCNNKWKRHETDFIKFMSWKETWRSYSQSLNSRDVRLLTQSHSRMATRINLLLHIQCPGNSNCLINICWKSKWGKKYSFHHISKIHVEAKAKLGARRQEWLRNKNCWPIYT